MRVDKTSKTYLDEHKIGQTFFLTLVQPDVIETTGGEKKRIGREGSKFKECVLKEIELQP